MNGTLIEVSEEEAEEEVEEKEEIEDISRQVNRYGNDQMNRYGNRYNEPINRYNPNDRYNQRFKDQMNRDFDRARHGQQPEVRRQPFGKSEENDEEEEEEEEEKAEMLLHINPYVATEIQIKEAFCFDLTVLVTNPIILKIMFVLFFPNVSAKELHRDVGKCSSYIRSLWIDSRSCGHICHLCYCHHWRLLLCVLSHGQNSVSYSINRNVLSASIAARFLRSTLQISIAHSQLKISFAEISSVILLKLQREWILPRISKMWMIQMRRIANHPPLEEPMQGNLSVFSQHHNTILTIHLMQQHLQDRVRLIADKAKSYEIWHCFTVYAYCIIFIGTLCFFDDHMAFHYEINGSKFMNS